MLKFVIYLALVVQILCSDSDSHESGSHEKTLSSFEDQAWAQKCKTVSGVEADMERYERLFQEYRHCTDDILENNKARDEVMSFLTGLGFHYDSPFSLTMSDKQRTEGHALTQKYCLKLKDFQKCSDIMSPFYHECLTLQEQLGVKVSRNVTDGLGDFLCENDSAFIFTLLDSKVIECGMENKDGIEECVETFGRSLLDLDETRTHPAFAKLYKAEIFCNAVKAAESCIVSQYERCGSSEKATPVVKSLFSHISTHSACANSVTA